MDGQEGQGALSYFTDCSELPGIIEAIYKAVVALRRGGITSRNIAAAAFREKTTGRDIGRVFSEYETFL